MATVEDKPVSQEPHEAAPGATQNVTVSPVHKVHNSCLLDFLGYMFCLSPLLEKFQTFEFH